MKFGVGQSVARLEDKRFVTGTGCYTDDVTSGAGLRGPTGGARMTTILGIKGSGEAGEIGAPQAVVGAVCDALDMRHVDMPVTPQKIFDILHNRQAETEAE